jgi:hypothetical protein
MGCAARGRWLSRVDAKTAGPLAGNALEYRERAESEARIMNLRLILTSVFVLCMMRPAFADSMSAERGWYENLAAFETTKTAHVGQCLGMADAVNQFDSIPRRDQQIVNQIALESSLCLYYLRKETRDKMPAAIPLQFHTVFCKRALAYPDPAPLVRQTCSLKYEKFIEGL